MQPLRAVATVRHMWRRVSLDWTLALVGTALTEWVVLVHRGLGNPVAGTRWLTVAWPLLLDLPLAWRRRAPLASFLLVLVGIDAQALATGNSAEGLEVLFSLGVGTYSVAAYGSRRQALAGLVALIAGYAVFSGEDRNVRSGESGQLWSAAFFGVAAIAIWFAGVWVHSRREARALAGRAAALEHETASALADERARMARELHDIVSHNLSVVVLQAAGARASGSSASALEKIERSGREALVEMRRLLGVLREDGGDHAGFSPQPGIAQLELLADTVRAAGLSVELLVDGDCDRLPSALELSVYRIIQEALTNTLKHAGAARAQVRVRCSEGALTVDVVDDGATVSKPDRAGHGLVGMHERVALFGGDLDAGPRQEGGWAVRARLPIAAP
ncbi:MAG: sensor histidine kinase [Gaiellaceae bacterium]